MYYLYLIYFIQIFLKIVLQRSGIFALEYVSVGRAINTCNFTVLVSLQYMGGRGGGKNRELFCPEVCGISIITF